MAAAAAAAAPRSAGSPQAEAPAVPALPLARLLPPSRLPPLSPALLSAPRLLRPAPCGAAAAGGSSCPQMWAGRRAGNFRAGCECGAPAAVRLPWIRRREPLAACSAPRCCCCYCCRSCYRRCPRTPGSPPPPTPQVGAARPSRLATPVGRAPPRPAFPTAPSPGVVQPDLGKLRAPRPGPSWPTSGPGWSRRGRPAAHLGVSGRGEPRSARGSRDAERGDGGPGKPRGGERSASPSGSGGARARRRPGSRPGTLGRSRVRSAPPWAPRNGWGDPEGILEDLRDPPSPSLPSDTRGGGPAAG